MEVVRFWQPLFLPILMIFAKSRGTIFLNDIKYIGNMNKWF